MVRIFGIVSFAQNTLKVVTTDNLIELHIDDASSAFITLVEEALKPNGGKAQWGNDGYYFAEADEFVSLPHHFG